MLTQEAIIDKGRELGFEDIRFTTAEPFDEHKQMLIEMKDEYGWAETAGLETDATQYVADLIMAFYDNSDDRVRGMVAWALGNIGGADAMNMLSAARGDGSDAVKSEVNLALARFH